MKLVFVKVNSACSVVGVAVCEGFVESEASTWVEGCVVVDGEAIGRFLWRCASVGFSSREALGSVDAVVFGRKGWRCVRLVGLMVMCGRRRVCFA